MVMYIYEYILHIIYISKMSSNISNRYYIHYNVQANTRKLELK